jgi:hypothetical protein
LHRVREPVNTHRPALAWRIGVVAMVAAVAIGSLVWLACAENAARIRRHTYPPDFQYLSDQEIQSTMWQVAALTTSLDEIFDNPDLVSARRLEILGLLDQLETSVDALRHEGVSTNHPLINANLDTFREDIEKARRDVAREPPSYLRASAIPGACKYCHGG